MSGSEVSEDLSEWEMVLTGDNHLGEARSSLFPPTDQEGLQVEVDPSDDLNLNLPPSSSSSSSSSLDSSVEDGGSAGEDLQSGSEVPDGGIGRHLRFCFEVMRTGFVHLGSRVHDFAGFWSVLSVSRVVVTAVLVSVLYRKVRQWRCQIQEERKRHLHLLIRDRDEKINKLLLQVVRANEQLSARHRVPIQRQRVPIPVIRVRTD